MIQPHCGVEGKAQGTLIISSPCSFSSYIGMYRRKAVILMPPQLFGRNQAVVVQLISTWASSQPAQPTPPKEMAQFFSFDKFEITLSQPTMYLKARLWAMIDRRRCGMAPRWLRQRRGAGLAFHRLPRSREDTH